MPETQDWAAAPQTAVTALVADLFVTEGGGTTPLVVAVAGRSVVIAGFDLCPTLDAGDNYVLRGIAGVVLVDAFNNAELVSGSISPETPTVTIRPPLGAVFTGAGNGLSASYQGDSGTARQAVRVTVYYYLV